MNTVLTIRQPADARAINYTYLDDPVAVNDGTKRKCFVNQDYYEMLRYWHRAESGMVAFGKGFNTLNNSDGSELEMYKNVQVFLKSKYELQNTEDYPEYGNDLKIVGTCEIGVKGPTVRGFQIRCGTRIKYYGKECEQMYTIMGCFAINSTEILGNSPKCYTIAKPDGRTIASYAIWERTSNISYACRNDRCIRKASNVKLYS